MVNIGILTYTILENVYMYTCTHTHKRYAPNMHITYVVAKVATLIPSIYTFTHQGVHLCVCLQHCFIFSFSVFLFLQSLLFCKRKGVFTGGYRSAVQCAPTNKREFDVTSLQRVTVCCCCPAWLACCQLRAMGRAGGEDW